MAIVPSNVQLPPGRYRALPVTCRGTSIGRWSVVAWDPQRFLASYAEQFIAELEAHCRHAYPGRNLVKRAPPMPRPKERAAETKRPPRSVTGRAWVFGGFSSTAAASGEGGFFTGLRCCYLDVEHLPGGPRRHPGRGEQQHRGDHVPSDRRCARAECAPRICSAELPAVRRRDGSGRCWTKVGATPFTVMPCGASSIRVLAARAARILLGAAIGRVAPCRGCRAANAPTTGGSARCPGWPATWRLRRRLGHEHGGLEVRFVNAGRTPLR